VLVVGHDYEEYSAAVAGDWVSQVPAMLAWNHGVVHFLQALGSQVLHNHGLRLMRAGREVLEAIGDELVAARFARETRFLQTTGEHGLSAWDLLESAASVEARRMVPHAAWTSTATLGPAFAWLEALLGEEDASELFAFLTFFALLTEDAGDTFAWLARNAAEDAGVFKRARAAAVLDQLGWGEGFDDYWDLVSAGEPVGTPYLADPLREAMRRLGRSRLLELLARPAAHLDALEPDELRAVLPPVIVYPLRDGGLIHHLNGVALEDGGRFAGDALAEVGVFGAASQLVLHPEPAYCTHLGCPHWNTGLCRTWFNPPDNDLGHDGCGFVRVFANYAGKEPAAAWLGSLS
jgi:hypothetical protein